MPAAVECFRNETVKIIRAKIHDLFIDRFEAGSGETWCLVGANRSGIDSFFKLLAGELQDVEAEALVLPTNPGVISFRRQQDIFEEELRKDDTDFMDMIDPGTPARSFLHNPDEHRDLIRAFSMEDSLDKGYRQLSTGQSRKLMLLSRITQGCSSLVIQTPYDGLDQTSCRELDKALAACCKRKILIFIIVHNRSDIPSWCSHVGIIAGGRLAHSSLREKIMAPLDTIFAGQTPDFKASARELAGNGERLENREEELVRLKNGSAGYGGRDVFSDLDLLIRASDHTLVSGPNGCGKSTLLQVITGDHPACYRNDLRIFGIQRGSGESIWQIKQHMGIVSSELHRNYYVPGSTLHCIISGLYDSIGLYRPYTSADEKKALKWLERTGLAHEADTPFRRLSFADQRLVLIARALIKIPKLLILDEPTQGLDEPNRLAVLDFLEQVAEEELCTILYVSHRQDEFRDFFKQHLQM